MSRLIIHEPPLQVLPSLAEKIGLNEAIVLQQVHYWIENKRNKGREWNGHKWVFNTYEQWQEDNFPFWSVSTIQRIFSSLEKQRLIISEQIDKKKHDMTKFYRIAYDELEYIGMMEDSILTSSNTPNKDDDNKNTETTTKTTKKDNSAKTRTPKPKEKPLKANQIPEIILFRELTRRYPSKGSQYTVITSVTSMGDRLGRAPTVQDLEPFYREWCDRGYNPVSIKWLSEWAVSGQIPQNGKRPARQVEPVKQETPEQLAARREIAKQLLEYQHANV